MKNRALLWLFLFFALAPAGANATTSTISSGSVVPAIENQLGFCDTGGPAGYQWCHMSISFTPAVSGYLQNIRMNIGYHPGWAFDATSTPIVGIQANSAGRASGIYLASTTLATSSFEQYNQYAPPSTYPDFQFGSTFYLQAGTTYWAVVSDPWNYAATNFSVGGASAKGDFITSYNSHHADYSDWLSPGDPWIYIVLTSENVVVPVPEIGLIVPQNASTTGIFNEWVVNTSSTPQVGFCLIKYGLYPDTTQFSDYVACIADGPHTIPRTGTPGAFLFPPVRWAVEADLTDFSGNILASTTADFYYNPALAPAPTGTSTIVATCDPDSDFFTNSMCNMLVYLFYPSQTAMQQFSNLKTIYGAKPPFGYFALVSSTLGLIKNGTSSVELMNASTSDNFSGIFTPVRTGLVGVLWFLALWWMFHRFRHLDI